MDYMINSLYIHNRNITMINGITKAVSNQVIVIYMKRDSENKIELK